MLIFLMTLQFALSHLELSSSFRDLGRIQRAGEPEADPAFHPGVDC